MASILGWVWDDLTKLKYIIQDIVNVAVKRFASTYSVFNGNYVDISNFFLQMTNVILHRKS